MLPLWRQYAIRALQRRGYAIQAATDPTKFRNMALVAHIDSGKTTLTESILLKSNYLAASGSVDTGSTTTDFLPAERERGITIQSASIPVQWKDWTFNLIDTPGHADFGMEVESASRVIDGAVVLIDSVEGVEAQTKGVWRQLDRYGVATRMVFLNKMDRPGASFRASLTSLLAHRFHPHPMILTLPIASFDPQNYPAAEPGIEGVVDLVNWEIWKYDETGTPTRYLLPRNLDDLKNLDYIPSNHPILPHLGPARISLLENLAMFSEELMDELLSGSSEEAYLHLHNTKITQYLRDATLRSDILPVLCGSAMKNVGTELVLDNVGKLLASPVDVLGNKKIQANSPLRALAWKVTWDPKKGWMTFVRVYSGRLRRATTITNTSRDVKEKVSKLLLLYASQTEEVEELPFGSVGVILGLKYTRTGDTLSSSSTNSGGSALRDIIPPPAVISASVIPDSHSDLEPVQAALESLSRTDPSVRMDTQDGQLLVHGLGALHLEIMEGRLRDEWRVNFEFGRRRVSYRESISSSISSESTQIHSAEISGTVVNIDFTIRPLAENEPGNPIWEGNVVVDSSGKPLSPPEYTPSAKEILPHISSGIASALSNSPHSSLPMYGVHVTLNSWQTPSPATLLAGASSMIIRDLLRRAGMGPIMEPYFDFKVTVPEESLGRVVKDLTEHGAEVLDLGEGSMMGDGDEVVGYPEEGVYIPPLWLSPSAHGAPSLNSNTSSPQLKRSIRVIAPLSRMLDYSNRLRALSGGHGQFEMSNAGFKEVSEARKMEILREIGRA